MLDRWYSPGMGETKRGRSKPGRSGSSRGRTRATAAGRRAASEAVQAWDGSFESARALQDSLCERVEHEDRFGAVRWVAGVDVSADRGSDWLHAAIVVLDRSSGEIVDVGSVRGRARTPYVPGYLSFRELPPVLAAVAKLGRVPDLIVCDGHGVAHPRRFGIACHLGVALDLPVVGCAKSRLVGRHREPGWRRGSHTPLIHEGERIGDVLRTREGVKPIFVSVGHRVSIESGRRLLLELAPRLRLPIPIRAAHAEVNRLRRAAGQPAAGSRFLSA